MPAERPDPDQAGAQGPESSAERSGGIQSVDRALQILDILARRGGAGVSEIAEELGIHRSTAFRLLGALEARGMAEQNVSRGKYQVGVGVLRLASSISQRLSIVQQARPTLERLADELSETVNLAVRRSGYAINLDQAMGPSALASIDWIGNPTPLHATASGKILIAFLETGERHQVLGRRPLQRYTPVTVVDRDVLDAELVEVARSGIATTREELEAGLNAVAVAVRDYRGQVVGSVSVSGPAMRFNPDASGRLPEVMLAAGLEISERLGHAAGS